MQRAIFCALVVGAATFGEVLPGAGGVTDVPSAFAQAATPPRDVTTCAQVTADTRQEAYGYTHVVALKNGCDKAVICEVWTDVDPEPKNTLRAMPGETESVVTRRGSPAREVSAQSSCRYQPRP
jgi:hypothetical protein